jgi:hypothetical protein
MRRIPRDESSEMQSVLRPRQHALVNRQAGRLNAERDRERSCLAERESHTARRRPEHDVSEHVHRHGSQPPMQSVKGQAPLDRIIAKMPCHIGDGCRPARMGQ